MRIDNITDQIHLFMEDIRIEVENLKAMGFTTEQAIEITRLGIESMKTEVEHHKEHQLEKIEDNFSMLVSEVISKLQ